ncbi:MAG: hypothetical protein U0176_02100 [Bacteroidia bacterium]
MVTTPMLKEMIKSAVDDLDDDWMINELADFLGLESKSRRVFTQEQEALIAQSEREIAEGKVYSDEEVFKMSEEWLGE